MTNRRGLKWRRQRGVAAVELAVLTPILILLLTVPLFFARYFWHYTVAHKAAHDAARYLSSISARELRTQTMLDAALKVTNDIATEEIADLHPGGDAPTISIGCGGAPGRCDIIGGGPLPETVTVRVQLFMFDNIFGAVYTGDYGLPIRAEAEVRYVGY